MYFHQMNKSAVFTVDIFLLEDKIKHKSWNLKGTLLEWCMEYQLSIVYCEESALVYWKDFWRDGCTVQI